MKKLLLLFIIGLLITVSVLAKYTQYFTDDRLSNMDADQEKYRTIVAEDYWDTGAHSIPSTSTSSSPSYTGPTPAIFNELQDKTLEQVHQENEEWRKDYENRLREELERIRERE